MGTVFQLIADGALRPEDPDYYPECQVCGRAAVPVYPCQGFMIGADGSANRSQDIYVACEACLKQGRVAHLGEYRTDPLIERYADQPAEAKAILRATPRIPFQMQGDDWPLCCGRLTEFVGSPGSFDDLVRVQAECTFWDQGEAKSGYDARVDGPPESLREVGLFLCGGCARGYWVHQPT